MHRLIAGSPLHVDDLYFISYYTILLYFISYCNCWMQAAEKLKFERGEAFDLAADAKGSE